MTDADSTAMAGLQVDISVRRSQFDVCVAFDVAPGESLAVLGPNGAGKSTVLAVLAGLLLPDRGVVTSNGRVLTRRGLGEHSVQIAAEHRRVGLMGQDPLLFPHLTAEQNVAFGPRAQHVSKSSAEAAAREWLMRMGLSDFAHRRPAQLSGGQRQRVALARALAAEPDVVLLDEPLGALDVGTAPEIRQTLRTHLRDGGVTSILVTHDVVDAAVLTDRMLVMSEGRIVESGPTAELLATPRSSFGALLAGLNLARGRVVSGTPPDSDGRSSVVVSVGGGLQITGYADHALSAGAEVLALFPPAAVVVGLTESRSSAQNRWRATITDIQAGPSTVRLRASGPIETGVDVTPAAVADLDLRPGQDVVLSVKAGEVRVYPE